MQILINAGDVQTSDAINQHVHAEVEAALEIFRDRITRVEVYFHDVNGPKAGIDKQCLMEARIGGLQPLAVEHQAMGLYEAITGAAGKLQRAVRSRLERLRDRA